MHLTSVCCGAPHEDVATPLERRMGVVAVRCRRCGRRYELLTDLDEPPAPKEPTAERPGSEGKIKTMRTRAGAGEAIFHPDDCGTAVRQRAVGEKSADLPAGVDYLPSKGKYRARVGTGSRGRRAYLGLFDTLAEAVAARRKALDERDGPGEEENGKPLRR